MAEKKADTSEKLIASNPTAHMNYQIEEVVEAGIALTGTEIKSIRAMSPNIKDAFVEVNAMGAAKGQAARRLEAWLVACHIGPYSHGNIWNHVTNRRRKLLLHRNQIERMYGAITQDGRTVIVLRMYFKNGRAKLELGLGRGKRKGDKREDSKKKSAQREIDQVMKKNRR